MRVDDMRIKTLSIREHGQDIVFQTFSPVSGLALMNTRPARYADNQRVEAQSPSLATNLGLYKICVHINVDSLHPKAVVYEFAQPVGRSGQSANGDQEAGNGGGPDKAGNVTKRSNQAVKQADDEPSKGYRPDAPYY